MHTHPNCLAMHSINIISVDVWVLCLSIPKPTTMLSTAKLSQVIWHGKRSHVPTPKHRLLEMTYNKCGQMNTLSDLYPMDTYYTNHFFEELKKEPPNQQAKSGNWDNVVLASGRCHTFKKPNWFIVLYTIWLSCHINRYTTCPHDNELCDCFSCQCLVLSFTRGCVRVQVLIWWIGIASWLIELMWESWCGYMSFWGCL